MLPGYPNEISEKWTAVRHFCQVAGINTQRAACAGAYAAAWPPARPSAWLMKRRIAAKSAGLACDASIDAKTSGEGRAVAMAGGVAVSSALSALAALELWAAGEVGEGSARSVRSWLSSGCRPRSP